HQLLVRTISATNHNTPLPFNTSLWNGKFPIPPAAVFIQSEGLQMMDIPSSIIYCTPGMFTKNAAEIRTALAMIPDASGINSLLLKGGHSTIGGRLAGAFRNIGRERIADDIKKTMQAAGYDIRETDPFDTTIPLALFSSEKSPYANRIKLLWYEMRVIVIKHFPAAPGLPHDKEAYLKQVEEIYATDAYHSLSIERYQVTPALIEKVKGGNWNFYTNAEDKQQRDAMAARGYWQATQKVRDGIEKILNGNNAGEIADAACSDWYRELFAPSVQAGIINAADLAGFRNKQVIISGSRHMPLNNEALRDAMPALFDLLQQEPEASVRAVLGHFIFVYIHPYIDGNGRMGRFLMNVMLASGGYPWTVIPVQQRTEYMQALEQASAERNIEPFTKFIAYLVNESMKGRPVAVV
ncbi:MAG: Fic family protein, partial [Chitinophagaceae bacterium]